MRTVPFYACEHGTPGGCAKCSAKENPALFALPWKVQHAVTIRPGQPAQPAGYVIHDAQGAWIATTGDERTAHLLKAAPRLLAALEALVADFDRSVSTTDPMLLEARAAIAEAGRQS